MPWLSPVLHVLLVGTIQHPCPRLPACALQVRAPDGSWAYRGPRVRMGIHWAEEGSVNRHVHALTKHRIYSGPAFQVGV